MARLEMRTRAWTSRAGLSWRLALLAVLLAAPSLFIGFYLDDHVSRFLFSGDAAAERLFHIYAGGYGMANGVAADTHWLIEQGFAPWWTPPDLLVRFWRPLSLLTHQLDFAAWPQSALCMHAHSLMWLALLVLAATHVYRSTLGTPVGGLAALLLALDHTHGFSAGFISNRHALITATFGLVTLGLHHRTARSSSALHGAALLPWLAFVATLAAGEFGVAIAGYLAAYACCADARSWRVRLVSLLPYGLIVVAWRSIYGQLGYGAHHSGLYLDPLRDPLRFVSALIERAPVLTLGQFLLPPAEPYVFYTPLQARVVWCLGVVFCAALALLLWPLVRRDRMARFWALGALLSLIPACAAFPSSRQLLMSSLGAMALIAQLWHACLDTSTSACAGRWPSARWLTSALLSMHLLLSPLIAPLAACGIMFAGAYHHATAALGPEVAGKDVVLITAPDVFALRLPRFVRAVEGGPMPRRMVGLSAGPESTELSRVDDRTLRLTFAEGMLSAEYSQLFRDARLPMRVGEHVALPGLRITVREVTADGRGKRVDYAFARSLDDPSLVFYVWRDGSFARLTLPALGGRLTLPRARLSTTMR